jgi:hypothetical protein
MNWFIDLIHNYGAIYSVLCGLGGVLFFNFIDKETVRWIVISVIVVFWLAGLAVTIWV